MIFNNPSSVSQRHRFFRHPKTHEPRKQSHVHSDDQREHDPTPKPMSHAQKCKAVKGITLRQQPYQINTVYVHLTSDIISLVGKHPPALPYICVFAKWSRFMWTGNSFGQECLSRDDPFRYRPEMSTLNGKSHRWVHSNRFRTKRIDHLLELEGMLAQHCQKRNKWKKHMLLPFAVQIC